LIAGGLVVAGAVTVTVGAGAAATAATATTVGTAVMADGDPTNEVNAVLDTANAACGGDSCASEIEQIFSSSSSVPYERFTPDPNRYHHIFDYAKHSLDDVIESFGGRQPTFDAVYNEFFQVYVLRSPASGHWWGFFFRRTFPLLLGYNH